MSARHRQVRSEAKLRSECAATRGEGALHREPTLEEKVRALRSATTYPQPPGIIHAIETHFAWVFLADTVAFKLKKPMRIAGVDLSPLSAREALCLEEVRLNRRLASDVYLGVESLTLDRSGKLHVGGEGAVVEWLVKMRRLPDALMLDRAIAANTVDAQRVQAFAQVLCDFYISQRAVKFQPEEYFQRLSKRIDSEILALEETALALPLDLLAELSIEQRRALDALHDEIEKRAQQGRIVEAHGDLRPEHVCLSTPPVVIDCLEFSRDLRILDALEELAFFAVECTTLGAAWVGSCVLDGYRERTRDPFSAPLLDFYRSKSATTRAKLIAWHVLDPEVREQAPWGARATAYLRRALAYTRAAR